MIKITIQAEGDRVLTAYDEENIKLNEVSLVIYEFERVKKELLEIEFDKEVEVEKK